MNRLIVFLIISLYSIPSRSQPYPKNYFANPIDPPFILAGNFGEIRPDHFHSGLDFSTSEVEGKPVYAAADGYVSRIKISPFGFGKAIYITHPNGYVTVYGHLKKLSSALEKYVVKNQYEKESFDIELFPNPDEFKVKEHEVIAYSGNTGASGGPHLHFEIRDAKTEEPINPLLFGYEVPDAVKPEIKLFRVVPVRTKGVVASTDTSRTYDVVKSADGIYALTAGNSIKVFGKIGFEFSLKDYQNNSGSTIGIYSMQLKIDSTIVYSYQFDRFSFSDTRYANAHIDYAEKFNDDLVFERCFHLPGNHMKIYKDTLGYYDFKNDGTHNVEATVKDFNGNTSVFQCKIISLSSLSGSAYQVFAKDFIPVSFEKGISIHKSNVEFTIPPGALYETYFLSDNEAPEKKYFFSSTYTIGEPTEPLHLPMTIGIKPLNIPDTLKRKALIVSFNKKGKLVAEGGDWNKQFLSMKTRHFGTFAIAVDTVAPTINLISFPSDKNSTGILKIKINDDLSGIKSYRATLDGKWFLMEYDAKNNLLSGEMTESAAKNSHQLELVVKDVCGNESRLVRNFNY